jgi:hypothetical protein
MRVPLRRSEPARKRAPAGRWSDHVHQRHRAVFAGVLQRQRVLHEVAGGRDLLTGGLAQHQQAVARIERQVHGHRGGRRDHEVLPEGSGLQAERRVRQGLQIRDRALRREDVVGRRHHLESVVARRHQRETEHARREGVLGAALVRDRLAGHHLAGITAHAVVAVHGGGKPRVGVDQANPRAIDRQAGLRIEHQAERIDQRIGLRRIGVVGRVDVGRVEFGITLDLQHAVVGRAAGRRRDIAHEHAGVRAGFGQPQDFAVTRDVRGNADVHGFDRTAIAVAIGIRHAHENRVAGMRDRRVLHRDGSQRIQRSDALRRRRASENHRPLPRHCVGPAVEAARARRFVACQPDAGAGRQRLDRERDFVRAGGTRGAGGRLVRHAADIPDDRAGRRDLRHGLLRHSETRSK